MHKDKGDHHERGVVRSRSEPTLKDKSSSIPSTSFAAIDNNNNDNHLFYEGELRS